jgi:putative acetyltransferase
VSSEVRPPDVFDDPPMLEITIRKLTQREMKSAATVHRIAFAHRLPWLAGLHTAEEDERYFRDHLFPRAEVWGALEGDILVGIMAFRDGWIDQLYVRPDAQGKGVGTRLLEVAQASCPRLYLWTFQRNAQARRFYENRGFTLVRETDGSTNQEKEPDALYSWSREP